MSPPAPPLPKICESTKTQVQYSVLDATFRDLHQTVNDTHNYLAWHKTLLSEHMAHMHPATVHKFQMVWGWSQVASFAHDFGKRSVLVARNQLERK